MTVNIKKLLREIFNEIRNNQPNGRVVTYDVIRDKLTALELGSDPKKQEKMIYLVLGAILHDLQMKKVESPLVKDYRASFNGVPLTYQTLDHFSGAHGKRVTLDELFYSLGRFIFLRIIQDQVSKNNILALFSSNHSYGNSFLHCNFLANKVQQLVDFCISHSDRLEVEEINLNRYSMISARNEPAFTNPSPIKPVEPPPLLTNSNLGLLILGGFVTALGITAVALAFTALSASTLGMSFVAIAGFAGLIGGLGLLCTGGYKHHQYVFDESYVELSDFEDELNSHKY